MTFAERIDRLSPDKVDLLMKRINPRKYGAASQSPKPAREKRLFRALEDQNYSLEIEKPGLLDTMELRVCPRRMPGPGEVEIEVVASGINFRDVMIALGNYPTSPGAPRPAMGVDCAGRIVRVGANVDSARVGDDVMCITSGFGKYILAHSVCLMPKPSHFTFEQAAGLPCVYGTAQLSMIILGRLKPGESVLIHSAAGGVGLAAIQVARAAGATIYATAGTLEKRDFLRGLGITHIFDSRSTSFADEILEVTDGQGVDMVLNSLSGDAIQKGFDILRPMGRFLELGKRDLAENKPLGMFPFCRGCTFFGIDLSLLSRYFDPQLLSTLFDSLGRLFQDGVYGPLPFRTYSLADASSAFNYMMQGKHIGKLVLTVPDQGVLVTPTPSLAQHESGVTP
jgi:NADPH:quinone reductase-like Zn-dependent oxidoreductase